MTMNEPHSISPENVPQFRDWIANRGGVAIWRSINLSNPGASWSTPAKTVEGEPTPKPTWQASNQPERIITDPNEIVVVVPREIRRFRVGVQHGDGLSLKVTDGGTRRIRAAVAKFPDAWYEFDYGTQEAIIFVPLKSIPLSEWKDE
jgi:hypothetical protein